MRDLSNHSDLTAETEQAFEKPFLGDDAERSPLWPFAAGVMTAACLLGLAVFAFIQSGAISQFAVFTKQDERALAIPQTDVVAARSILLEMSATVETLKQKLSSGDNIPGLERDRFVPLSRAFSDLFKAMPVRPRQKVDILIRKDGDAYKILFQSALCPVAVEAGEYRIDPKREQGFSTLCRYFAVWSDGGEDF